MVPLEPSLHLVQLLHALNADIHLALARLSLPAYILDRNGTIRWANAAALAIWPNALNRKGLAIVAPDEMNRTRDEFTRKLLGDTDATQFTTAAVDPDGRRIELTVSSVTMRVDGEVVGVFGVATPMDALDAETAPVPTVELTPRQHDVLRLLGEGRSTKRIAEELGIAEETARNHIKAVMRSLGARSRLEAVVAAHSSGLL
jgi:DNA-binding CsgD family transcriptional regulator